MKKIIFVACGLLLVMGAPVWGADDRLDQKGDRIDARLDRKGERINERLDRRGDRVSDRKSSR